MIEEILKGFTYGSIAIACYAAINAFRNHLARKRLEEAIQREQNPYMYEPATGYFSSEKDMEYGKECVEEYNKYAERNGFRYGEGAE